MGLIGKDLLNRIQAAEEADDWQLTVELLAMAQLQAAKRYAERVADLEKVRTPLTGHIWE